MGGKERKFSAVDSSLLYRLGRTEENSEIVAAGGSGCLMGGALVRDRDHRPGGNRTSNDKAVPMPGVTGNSARHYRNKE